MRRLRDEKRSVKCDFCGFETSDLREIMAFKSPCFTVRVMSGDGLWLIIATHITSKATLTCRSALSALSEIQNLLDGSIKPHADAEAAIISPADVTIDLTCSADAPPDRWKAR
jgi:hypothetical protein